MVQYEQIAQRKPSLGQAQEHVSVLGKVVRLMGGGCRCVVIYRLTMHREVLQCHTHTQADFFGLISILGSGGRSKLPLIRSATISWAVV